MRGGNVDQDRVGEIPQAGTVVLGEMSPGFLWVFRGIRRVKFDASFIRSVMLNLEHS